jgi:hypothetical protein
VWLLLDPTLASIFRAKRTCETGTTIAVTFMVEAICSSETSFLTRATRRHIPEDSIHQFLACLGAHSQRTNETNSNRAKGKLNANEKEKFYIIQVTTTFSDAKCYTLRRNACTPIKKTPWPLVRKRTIPTEQPPLIGEI